VKTERGLVMKVLASVTRFTDDGGHNLKVVPVLLTLAG
jgi:hypothetical protein